MKKTSKKKNKKKSNQIYEQYPASTVFIVSILQLLVFVAGLYIMFTLHWITGILFLIFLIILEIQLYREGCVNCCYYGKRCAFGKGIIASKFFKRGDPKIFRVRNLSWKDFIPQILVVAIPLVVGIALLISRGFNVLILIAIVYPILSWFFLNNIIYGKLACPHCKQGSICCPALNFFDKSKK